MYYLHCTKKLLDRIKPTPPTADASTTQLGNWYATALFTRPQLALLVNEQTLLPVLLPLAPAATLTDRFPLQLAQILAAHGIAETFIETEMALMQEVSHAKTGNRSVLGIMNQFTYLIESQTDRDDLLALSLKLSRTPCGPLYKGPIFPDKALKELVLRRDGLPLLVGQTKLHQSSL